MKITVNVNIAGMHFVIEEDACKVLKKYLDEVASRLSSQSDESYPEVEGRVAEILRSKIVDSFMVVTMIHVREVMSIIGNPEVFGGAHRPEANFENRKGRLLRDTENRILGGVCSGISLYFGVDTSLVRVAMVLFAFLGGTVILYIILWIVIPKASTLDDFETLENMRKRK